MCTLSQDENGHLTQTGYMQLRSMCVDALVQETFGDTPSLENQRILASNIKYCNTKIKELDNPDNEF